MFVFGGCWFIELYQLMVGEKGSAQAAILCLWNCDFAMEIWKITITMLIPIYLRVV